MTNLIINRVNYLLSDEHPVICICQKMTSSFLETSFKNGAEMFINLITEYESKRAEEHPF